MANVAGALIKIHHKETIMEKITIHSVYFASSGLTIVAPTDKEEFWLSAGKNGYMQFRKLPDPDTKGFENLYHLIAVQQELLPIPQPVFTASNCLVRTPMTMAADLFVDTLFRRCDAKASTVEEPLPQYISQEQIDNSPRYSNSLINGPSLGMSANVDTPNSD
ncbi:TPA: hypothetical protein NIU80_004856 [Klebsiella variicola]|nr:hypothetical protein [Klebsiella variicola]